MGLSLKRLFLQIGILAVFVLSTQIFRLDALAKDTETKNHKNASPAGEKKTRPKKAEVFDHTHADWTAFLSKYVVLDKTKSQVRYQQIKNESSGLLNYIKSLQLVTKADYAKFSDLEKLAFLINAYNAFTIQLIIDHYPVKSIKDIGGFLSSPWKKKFFNLLEDKRSLDEIEHEMIRKNFNEPRIHFAVVCASIGCPALLDVAYRADRIEEQLEGSALRFLGDQSRNRFVATKKTLEISSIFKWYGDDFPKQYGSLEAFLATRMGLETELQRSVSDKQVKIKFLDYDWSLNDLK